MVSPRCIFLCVAPLLVRSELASIEDVMDTDSLEDDAVRLSLLQARPAQTHRAGMGKGGGAPPPEFDQHLAQHDGNPRPETFPVTPRSYEDLVPPDFYPASMLLEEPAWYDNQRTNHFGAEICSRPTIFWLNDTFPQNVSKPIEILDVGGGEGMIERLLYNLTEKSEKQFNFSCVDIVASEFCVEYPGDHLNLPADSKDIVMFNEMFHHVPYSTIDLLQDAAKVSRRFVIVLDYVHPQTWPEAQSIFDHEWMAPLRSEHEWEKLFDLLDYQIFFKQRAEKFCTYPNIFEYFDIFMWVLEVKGKSGVSIGGI